MPHASGPLASETLGSRPGGMPGHAPWWHLVIFLYSRVQKIFVHPLAPSICGSTWGWVQVQLGHHTQPSKVGVAKVVGDLWKGGLTQKPQLSTCLPPQPPLGCKFFCPPPLTPPSSKIAPYISPTPWGDRTPDPHQSGVKNGVGSKILPGYSASLHAWTGTYDPQGGFAQAFFF